MTALAHRHRWPIITTSNTVTTTGIPIPQGPWSWWALVPQMKLEDRPDLRTTNHEPRIANYERKARTGVIKTQRVSSNSRHSSHTTRKTNRIHVLQKELITVLNTARICPCCSVPPSSDEPKFDHLPEINLSLGLEQQCVRAA